MLRLLSVALRPLSSGSFFVCVCVLFGCVPFCSVAVLFSPFSLGAAFVMFVFVFICIFMFHFPVPVHFQFHVDFDVDLGVELDANFHVHFNCDF